MNRFFQAALLLAAVLLLLPPAAQSHKLSIFAWPEGGEIRGEVKFNGGRKAKNVQILAQNAADQTVLAETVCDENGAFRFALPEQALKDLLIVANGGEGHRGEWLLEAKEYASAVAAGSSVSAGSGSTSSTAAAAVSSGLSEQQFRRIMADELSKGLAPVRKSLAESLDPEPTLRDILGGIGWLVGLAGMAAWAQSRRAKKS